MANETNAKKRLVVSYHNLSAELQSELKKLYPYGFTDHMIRIDKGPGDFFYAVVMETEDTKYLIKVDVKIDDKPEEEEDKEYYDDDIKGAEEIMEGNDEGDDE